MGDYPDYTDLVQLVGSDIMVPIDIQGAYIMLPVDIQAQYVTLEIDIIAQSIGNIAIDIKAQTIGNLAVNIAASAVTLQVNIASQTANINVNIAASAITMNVSVTGTANIQIAAQTVGVYLQPEWTVKEGTDKEFSSIFNLLHNGYSDETNYQVPTGTTLFITSYGFHCYGQHPDCGLEYLNQIGYIELDEYVPPLTYTFKASGGGNGGIVANLTKPIAIVGGKYLAMFFVNQSGHRLSGKVFALGFEV